MPITGHEYEHRQGRGNRYPHVYDDIILDYMLEEQMNFDMNNVDPMWGYPKPFEYKPQSLSTLFKVVRERARSRVSWSTIINHLNILVDEHVLKRETKAGSNNETFYRLSRIRGTIQYEIFVKSLVTRDGTTVEHITDTIRYTRPPSYYYYYFHPFPWSKIDVPASCLGFL